MHIALLKVKHVVADYHGQIIKTLYYYLVLYCLRFAFCVVWFLGDMRRDNVAKQLSYKFYCAVNAVGEK